MFDYTLFLRISGLKKLIKLKNEDDDKKEGNYVIDIDIEAGIVDVEREEIITKCSKQCYRNTCHIVNILYGLFVIFIISVPTIGSIFLTVQDKEVKIFTSNIFSYLILIQYFLGIQYFNSKHFFKIVQLSDNSDKLIKVPFIAASVISCVFAIISTSLLMSDININVYSEMKDYTNDTGRIFLAIVIFLEKLYSYNIYFLNTIAFAIVMIVQSDAVSDYTKMFYDKLEDMEEFNINTIMNEYLAIKARHAGIVDKFNNIFSFVTLIGIINMYFVVINHDTEYVGVMQYFNCCCILIIEMIYISSMIKVKDALKNIKKGLDSPKFTAIYFHKYTLDTNSSNSSSGILSNYSSRKRPNSIEMQEIIFTNLEECDKYKQKEKNNNNTDNNNAMNSIREITLRTLIDTKELNTISYWNAIENKLNEPLESFNLFGFEIDDTSLIQKAIAVATGIVLTENIKDKFGF